MKKTVRALALLLSALVLCSCMGCGLFASESTEPTKAPETPSDTAAPADTAAPESGDKVAFEGVDVFGNPVSMESFADKEVVMINFWETWCGPCMSELPAIEALYERYAENGFAVLGVYASSKASEVKTVVENLGVTYTVMQNVDSLTKYQTNYVPTTIFCDGSGNLLTAEPYIGSMSEAEWENIILTLLGECA